MLSPVDRQAVAKGGICVIDGSWRRITVLFRGRIGGIHRRLPLLLAANPVNYAKPYILSSVEAAAAALYITGFRGHAIKLMELYKWGRVFLELNRELLEAYAAAKTASEVERIECETIAELYGIQGGDCASLARTVLQSMLLTLGEKRRASMEV